MAVNQTSFTKTPQATDDFWSYTENDLLFSASYNNSLNILSLDVTANDLGGNAKALYSIDDGNGHTSLADYDLLNSDMQGVWESAGTNGLGV